MDKEDLRKYELKILDDKISLKNSYESQEIKRLKTLIKKEDFEQDSYVMAFLEKTDDNFRSLIHENISLLVNENIVFEVIREADLLFASHPVHFNGDISEQGFLSYKTTQNDTAYFFFQKGRFPISYKGLVNYLGETELWADKRIFSLFRPRIPVKYKGVIDPKGNISIQVSETRPHGKKNLSVAKITADVFAGDELKRSSFLANRSKMKSMISFFREELIKKHAKD